MVDCFICLCVFGKLGSGKKWDITATEYPRVGLAVIFLFFLVYGLVWGGVGGQSQLDGSVFVLAFSFFSVDNKTV